MRPLRPVLVLLLTVLTLGLITARPTPAEAQSTLETIKNRGKIIIGVKTDFPPFGSVDASGKNIGFDVDMSYELTRRLLPGMVQRRRGAVLNVASLAAYGATPYTSTYGATKAFLLSFSESLAVELEGTSVHVVCVCPGFTRTEFQEKAHIDTSVVPAFAWMSAEEVADQAITAVGQRTVLVNGLLNRVMATAVRLAPRSLVARATLRTNARAAH